MKDLSEKLKRWGACVGSVSRAEHMDWRTLWDTSSGSDKLWVIGRIRWQEQHHLAVEVYNATQAILEANGYSSALGHVWQVLKDRDDADSCAATCYTLSAYLEHDLSGCGRLDAEINDAIKRIYPCPPEPGEPADSPNRVEVPAPNPRQLQRAIRIIKAGCHAAKSVTKTTIGIDALTDDQVEARLEVCRNCPGNHATFDAQGEVHTCGPMIESVLAAGGKTCGCVLRLKAKDAKEDCPQGWWPAQAPGQVLDSL